MRRSFPVTYFLLSSCLPTYCRSTRLAFSNTALTPRAFRRTSRATRWSSATIRHEESLPSIIDTTTFPPRHHVVDGVICREIPMELPFVGVVTVLEATAEAQESLVDMALAMDDAELEGTPQKLEAGDPYGAVLWPAAWSVANYLLTSPDLRKNTNPPNNRPLEGLSILELGTGTGLVSIAAAFGGASVLATDYEPLALTLTEYAVQHFSNDGNKEHLPLSIVTKFLDMCDYATPLPRAEIVVAADIMYEPKTGIAMAHRAVEALQQGSRVIVGDSPGRPGRPAFLKTLQELGVADAAFVETMGRTCSGPRHDLICGKGSTSISEVPQELPVAIMDLRPFMLVR